MSDQPWEAGIPKNPENVEVEVETNTEVDTAAANEVETVETVEVETPKLNKNGLVPGQRVEDLGLIRRVMAKQKRTSLNISSRKSIQL